MAITELNRDGAKFLEQPSPSHQVELSRIEPTSGWVRIGFGELWAYRELIYFFVWADIKVRYKQTVLGASWAILQPVFTMIVFSIFFGRLAGIPSEGVPYPVFVYTALVPWTYFANALSASSNSLLNGRALITKVYFPRLILPITSVLTGLLDLLAAFSILIVLMLYYGIVPSAAMLLLPLFIALAAATALSVALWLSALGVQYRDIRYIVPFLVQIWLFATPVAYPSSLVPEEWRAIYGLNPMAGVIDGFRWALLGRSDLSIPLLAVSVSVVITLLTGGLFYFRRMERSFVDVA